MRGWGYNDDERLKTQRSPEQTGSKGENKVGKRFGLFTNYRRLSVFHVLIGFSPKEKVQGPTASVI